MQLPGKMRERRPTAEAPSIESRDLDTSSIVLRPFFRDGLDRKLDRPCGTGLDASFNCFPLDSIALSRFCQDSAKDFAPFACRSVANCSRSIPVLLKSLKTASQSPISRKCSSQLAMVAESQKSLFRHGVDSVRRNHAADIENIGGFGAFEFIPIEGGGWAKTDLHEFGHKLDGTFPIGNLFVDASGNVYGSSTDRPSISSSLRMEKASPAARRLPPATMRRVSSSEFRRSRRTARGDLTPLKKSDEE